MQIYDTFCSYQKSSTLKYILVANQNKILTVTQLNNSVKQILEYEFSGIWLIGELSNFVQPSSGHWYFTLKDKSAQVKCAMFRGNNRSVSLRPADGMQVIVRARVSLYTPRGDYQLIVEHMEPAGDGLLKQQFEQLKAALAAQGLFNHQDKRPIPQNVQRVGIITSPTGAAVKDILTVLHRRAPQLKVIIYPALVQGEQAEYQLISALNTANERNEVDVIILGRGGGSLEDLWCFNSEALAHAIYNSGLPIVSAVGHEVDVTISDHVSDVRAATPSAAAELVSPDNNEQTSKLTSLTTRLHHAVAAQLKHSRFALSQGNNNLMRHHPLNKLQLQSQRLDHLSIKLDNAIKQKLAEHKRTTERQLQKLLESSPDKLVNKHQQNVQLLTQKLEQLVTSALKAKRYESAALVGKLDALSPLKVLNRGYSITSEQDSGGVISHAHQVKKGDVINTQLADGTIKSQVL